MSELVSIIIPCYNNEAFLRGAVASALRQTYPSIEVIAIDDGSTDKSQAILRTFGDRIRWEVQSNQGAPVARNRGLALAQGTYIKFLDADDILLPGAIGRQVQQAQQLPGNRKAIVCGDAVWVDQDCNLIPGYFLRARQPHEDPITYILNASPLTSCPLHNRNYLLEINGFDPTLPRGQEHDLHLRLALAGVEFIYYPGAIYKYRNYSHNDRISNRTLSSQGALVHYHILQKQLALVQASQTQTLSPSIRRAFAQRFWQFGRGILREGDTEAARQYFQAAKALDAQHCIVGNPPYPNLVKWLGPQRAEAVFTTFKQLKLKLIR